MGQGWWEQPIIHSAHVEFGEDDGGLPAMQSILSKLDLGPGSAGGGGGGGSSSSGSVGSRSEQGTHTAAVTGALSNSRVFAESNRNQADPHHSNCYNDSSQVMQPTSEVHAGPVVGEGGTRPCVLPHRRHTPTQNAQLLSTESSHKEGEGNLGQDAAPGSSPLSMREKARDFALTILGS